MVPTLVMRRIASLPMFADTPLCAAYLAGDPAVASLYAHPVDRPLDAVEPRCARSYPRGALTAALREYNRSIGASPAALRAVDALEQPRSMCVVTGQQAGLLGGPLYTTYKIASAVALARSLSERLGVPVVPVFWLASEDHDFTEINHASFLRPDGSVGRVRFSWSGAGRSVSDLPLTSAVRSAVSRYLHSLPPGIRREEIAAIYEPDAAETVTDDSYCRWCASVWAKLFAAHGLVVVEPRIIRSTAGDFFVAAASRQRHIADALRTAARKVGSLGHTVSLDTETAGALFGYDADGRRVRLPSGPKLVSRAREHPELLSTDAALRPLLQDWVFPTLASVLGPGEIAYHSLLRGIYEVLALPQPAILPRQSLTVVDSGTRRTIDRAGLDPRTLLASEFDLAAVRRACVDPALLEAFDRARSAVRDACAELGGMLPAVDPNLEITHGRTVAAVESRLGMLEARSIRAHLAGRGIGGPALLRARNLVRPAGSWQERVFPLPLLMALAGTDVVERIVSILDPFDRSHHVLGL